MSTVRTELTIQEVAHSSGFSEPTLRYYEKIGLLGTVGRDPVSGHRRYGPSLVARIETLACLRSAGMTVDGLHRFLTMMDRGDEAADELADLFDEQAGLLAEEIARLRARHDYLRLKTQLWRARSAGDQQTETAAVRRIEELLAET